MLMHKQNMKSISLFSMYYFKTHLIGQVFLDSICYFVYQHKDQGAVIEFVNNTNL